MFWNILQMCQLQFKNAIYYNYEQSTTTRTVKQMNEKNHLTYFTKSWIIMLILAHFSELFFLKKIPWTRQAFCTCKVLGAQLCLYKDLINLHRTNACYRLGKQISNHFLYIVITTVITDKKYLLGHLFLIIDH